QRLSFIISASDMDAGQVLSLTATGLPPGASFAPSGATSYQFSWTPSFTQAGDYTVTFKVTDDGSPVLSDIKTAPITVGAKFAKTSGPEGGGVTSFLVSGTSVFAGARGGVLLSTNNGRSWTELGEGLPADKDVLSLAVSGANLFAGTGGVGTSSGAGIY